MVVGAQEPRPTSGHGAIERIAEDPLRSGGMGQFHARDDHVAAAAVTGDQRGLAEPGRRRGARVDRLHEAVDFTVGQCIRKARGPSVGHLKCQIEFDALDTRFTDVFQDGKSPRLPAHRRGPGGSELHVLPVDAINRQIGFEAVVHRQRLQAELVTQRVLLVHVDVARGHALVAVQGAGLVAPGDVEIYQGVVVHLVACGQFRQEGVETAAHAGAVGGADEIELVLVPARFGAEHEPLRRAELDSAEHRTAADFFRTVVAQRRAFIARAGRESRQRRESPTEGREYPGAVDPCGCACIAGADRAETLLGFVIVGAERVVEIVVRVEPQSELLRKIVEIVVVDGEKADPAVNDGRRGTEALHRERRPQPSHGPARVAAAEGLILGGVGGDVVVAGKGSESDGVADLRVNTQTEPHAVALGSRRGIEQRFEIGAAAVRREYVRDIDLAAVITAAVVAGGRYRARFGFGSARRRRRLGQRSAASDAVAIVHA